MSRLLEVADLCSRTLSDPANRLRKTRKKKSSAVPLFRSGHISAICARLSTGKVGVQRGRKTAGCPSFLPTAVGTASPPLGRCRKRAAPSGRTRLRSSYAPLTRCQGRCCPDRAQRIRASYAPDSRCRKALPTLRAPAYKSKTEVSLGFLLYLRRREPFLRSVAWRTSA